MHKTCIVHDVCAVYADQQLLTSSDASICKQFCHLLSVLCMIINMHAFISKSILNTPPDYYE